MSHLSEGEVEIIIGKTKDEINELVLKESKEISFEAVLGKNPKWKEFNRVLFNNQKTDFISCIKYKEILTHKKFSGTNVIMAHKCKTQLENQSKIDHFFAKKPINVNLSSIKKELTDSIIMCCAIDMRSFALIEGIGFNRLAQQFINIGAKYGSLNINDIIPTSHTVSNRLPNIYEKYKKSLYNITKDLRGIGVTLDLWKHDMTGAHYITITGHYISSDSNEKVWKMENFVLATREMKEKQTGLNIKETINVVLNEFGCGSDENYFVTDNAANMIRACDDKERYSCSGHNINLALKHTFNSVNKEIIQINDNINLVKEIVTLMKRKGLMRKFSEKFKAIPQEVQTRFNSVYYMLQVFDEVYIDLNEFSLIDKELQSKLLLIDEKVIKELIQILEMFDKSTLILSQNNSPTIYLVLPIKRRIISKLKIDEKDSYTIKEFKKVLESNVEQYLKIHFIHNFALFFDPKRKDLRLLEEFDKKEVIEILKQNMKSLSSVLNVENQSKKPRTEEPKTKKQKMTLSEEFLYESDEESVEVEIGDMYENEIEMYLKAVFCGPQTSNLLKFWLEYSNIYPNIANVAKKILALPATQFESERNFSMSGRTLESRRCRLSPENVDYLLFIKSNYNL